MIMAENISALNPIRLSLFLDVPEVLDVQMNEIKKKSNYVCAEFFQKVKTLNFVEKNVIFFLKGLTTS